MAPTRTEATKHARLQLRDERGHFVKGATVKTKISVSSPLGVEPLNPEFEKPLVSVSLNNPFKKILYWLDQIRRHQTTTFALKLSIPLIALPIVIVGVFSLGRLSGINFQKSQTTPPPIPSPQPVSISKAGTLKVAKGVETHYLLSLKNGEILNLLIPPTIDLTKYSNKQVLVTGTYNKTTGMLTVSDIAEVEVFNSTVIPSPTPQATSSSETNR